MTKSKNNSLNTTNSTFGSTDEGYALWAVTKAATVLVPVAAKQDGAIPVLDDGPVVRMIRATQEERTETLEQEEGMQRTKVGKKVVLRSDQDHMRASSKVDKRYSHLQSEKAVKAVKAPKVVLGSLALALRKAGLK